MDKTVLNLSKVALTQDQLSVLSKGLNFCPTPDEPDPGQYKIDLDSLHRRLRLRSRFRVPDDFDWLEQEDNHLKMNHFYTEISKINPPTTQWAPLTWKLL